ncbi:unnamed protein product [Caretta caretta]
MGPFPFADVLAPLQGLSKPGSFCQTSSCLQLSWLEGFPGSEAHHEVERSVGDRRNLRRDCEPVGNSLPLSVSAPAVCTEHDEKGDYAGRTEQEWLP